ncbi:hypothetical protein [Chryseobacterium sp. CCH4-E10]|uniref:hypothetical protein n=1 Tax=Chryseobacterium sp. CCH4-E10 TaxID=1768758 RepID=UPI000A87C24A|nr:hypothetical protein [Chryseobacterium sp. CCH4-E10]
MLQFILMLLGLAFGQNNAHTATCNDDNNGQPITQYSPTDGTEPGTGFDPGTGTGDDGTGGPGNGGSTGGNTGQNPPPLVKP